LTRTGYRLPTQAEWEYACRAGAGTAYSFGDTVDLLGKYSFFEANSSDRSHAVGTMKPNDFGLFDMHGNAWEWCQDAYEAFGNGRDGKAIEDKEDPRDITLITNISSRVLRSGAFNLQALFARSAYRTYRGPEKGNSSTGFRPARTFAP
jgi:formylglycine-generating enzyme required for sulfatase activity